MSTDSTSSASLPTPASPDPAPHIGGAADPPTPGGEDHLDSAVEAEIDADLDQLAIGTAEVLPAAGLRALLRTARREQRPLRIKLGIDPSGSELTLGHAVVLRKLRQFQDLGHTAVLIIGDFTGRVGDPTGRNETRRVLTAEQTADHSATYLEQAVQILRPDRLEVRRNSEWLGSMDFSEMLGYTSMLTVARLLERDDFAKRYSEGRPISLMEFMYPLMQGLDSVFVHSDVEIGGTDQTYNNLVGRTLQAQLDQPAQVVVTVPLLRGTDGGDKMGKSLGNFIAIREAPSEQYGKVLSISDDLVMHYAELCCAWTRAELAACEAELAADPFSGEASRRRRGSWRCTTAPGRPAMPPSTSIGAFAAASWSPMISPRTRCRPTAPSPSSTCSPPPASPPRSPTPDGFSPAAVCASTG
ncbi:MAG: tyrosine--tRNA ligase [Actinobacteria bacterium]|nr:tyrosine--tRNA ligase [Actinomycetota bacterium]